MKKLTFLLALSTLFCLGAAAQSTSIFPKGELSKTDNHTGNVWLTHLNNADSLIDITVATATFGPAAKLDWHIHPAGQILIVTEGTGYYQEKGKAIRVVNKGEVIKCTPGLAHWHGAAPQSQFTYIAVSTKSATNKTEWLQRVTDAEYNSAKN